MFTVVAAIVVFVMVALLLALGIVLGKKTPLKGSCHAGAANGKGGVQGEGDVCDSCTCGASMRRE